MANEKVDIVIVGAGASGSVYASVLAEAGKNALLTRNGLPDTQSASDHLPVLFKLNLNAKV